jgi:hypothetical protein
MLIELGLETLHGRCERLASDEPEAMTDLAHLYPSVQECDPAVFADTLFQLPPRPAHRAHSTPTPTWTCSTQSIGINGVGLP